MVAVIVGSGLGIEHSSAFVLGSRGQLGQSAHGRVGENVFVNAKTGNLVVSNRDEFLVGLGVDSGIGRTYNSLGASDGDNGDGWRASVTRRLHGLTGSQDTPGSTITRTGADGSAVVYNWKTASNAYVTTDGAGAYDSLKKEGTTWVWTDGDSQTTEVYSEIGSTGVWRITGQVDRDGNTLAFTYNGSGYVSRVTTEVGTRTEYTDLTYSGANLTQVKTTYWDTDTSSYKTLTRTRYGYDGSNRLTSVTVDLSPTDNTVADGKTYVTTYTYDGSSKRVASIRQSDGTRLDIAYEDSGLFRVEALAQTVATGVTRTTYFDYATSARTDVTHPDDYVTQMHHDADGNLVKIVEPAAVAGGTAQVHEFEYDENDNVTRIKTSANSWTDYVYDPTANGMWTARHEHQGSGATIATTRTYNTKNAVLTETRYQGLDPDGKLTTGTASGPMTTRYAYDDQNNLRYTVSAIGDVTRFDYSADGLLTRTTVFTGVAYDVSALSSTTAIAELSLNSWVSGITDKTQAAITENTYDFRGNLTRTTAYSNTLSTGLADTGGPKTRTDYVYDQAGQLLSRIIDGKAGAEHYLYDGMGRTVSAIDFNGGVTTTAFHDALGTTVVTLASGLSKISSFNRAGERIGYVETERGANLINLGDWPNGTPPAGTASIDGWVNSTNYVNDTRWVTATGPNGTSTVVMETGQIESHVAGGGNHTNAFTIDGSKAYEFVYYFRKHDLTRHSLYFGLSGGTPAYVEHATTGADTTNPYFYLATAATQQATFEDDRWYKVVAYVLPEGSAAVSAGSLGGVYDMTTGAKVADTTTFRWNDARVNDQVQSRFFNYSDQTNTGYSTYFGEPEVRETSVQALLGIPAPASNLLDLSGWPQGTPPSGSATVSGWVNHPYYVDDTRWATTSGPDGVSTNVIEAGQVGAHPAGGGNHTGDVTIDASQAYEFVYYFRKYDQTRHDIYFGLEAHATPYVKNATTGVATVDPYVYSANVTQQQATLEDDRWYKVVAYVLPEGSAAIAAGSLGGVYDMTTGARVADTTLYRWSEDRPDDQVSARFFNFSGEASTGYSTYFGKPEIRPVPQIALDTAFPEGMRYAYDVRGQLRLETDPTGARTHHLYDRVGRKVADIDADGSLAEYKYDLNDRLIATVRYATRLTPTQLNSLVDGSGNPTAVELAAVRPTGHADDAWTWQVYDDAGRVLQTIAGDGSTTLYTYDGASRLLSETRRAEKLNSTDLTAFKTTPPATVTLPSTSTSSNDRTTRYFFDADGRRVGALDAEGYVTEMTYDAGGRLEQTTAYAEQVTNSTLLTTGTFSALKAEVQSPTNGNDNRSWNVYDGRGLLRGSVNGEGDIVLYDYDASGHLSQTVTGRKLTVPAGGLASQPSLATLVAAPASPTLETTTYTRNAYGQVVTETKALVGGNETTTYTYNAIRQLVGVSVDRLSGQGPDYEVRSRYDARGRLIGQLSGEGSAALALLGGSPSEAAVDGIYRKWGTRFEYDDADRLIARIDADGLDGAGRKTLYYYDPDGNLAYEVSAVGAVTGHRYDALNRRTETITYGTAISTSGLVGGDLVGGLPSRTSLGSTDSRVIIAYTVTGAVASTTERVTTSTNRTTSFAYNAFGELSTRTSPFGLNALQTLYGYDKRGSVTSVMDSNNGVSRTASSTYDAFGREIQSTDARGVVRTTDYDRAGRVKVSRDGFGNTTKYEYDARGHVLTSEDRLGEITSYSHSAFGRQMTVTTPEGLVSTITYDDQGHVLTATDPEGRGTTQVYDRNGALVSSTNGLNETSTQTYDFAGQLYEATDASGVTVRYAYDGVGRQLTRRVDPTDLNLVTTYTYDAKGQVIEVVDPAGVETEYSFDLLGQTTAVTVDPGGLAVRTEYTYDDLGNVTRVREVVGPGQYRDITYGYDELGRVIVQQTGSADLYIKSTYQYDAHDNVIRRTDSVNASANVITRYAYDAENRLVWTIDGTGSATRTVYDAEGRITRTIAYATALTPTQITALGLAPTVAMVTSAVTATPSQDRSQAYIYDDDGRLIFSLEPTGRLTRNEYDGSGNVVRSIHYATAYTASQTPTEAALVAWTASNTSSSDQISRAAYDAAGRQTYSIDAAGYVTHYAHDEAGRVLRSLQYAAVYTPTTTPTDDDLDTWATTNAGASDRKSHVAYDGAGRAAFQVDAEGYVTRYTYNGAGQVTDESRFAPKFTVDDNVTASTLGGLVESHLGTAATSIYHYDGAGRLYRSIDAEDVETRLELDGLGRVIELIEAYDTSDAVTTTRTYDDGSRLLSEVRASGEAEARTVNWTYDGLGRALTKTDGGGRLTTRTYDDGSRLLSEVQASGKTEARTLSWTYDGFGRALTETDGEGRITTRTYDAMGRVLTVTRPLNHAESATTTNEYDVFGNLVKVTDPRGNASVFYFDLLDRMTHQVDPENYVTSTTYNLGGAVASTTRHVTKVGTPVVGTVPTITTHADDATTTFERDALDRLTGITDAEDHSETYELDAFGNRTKVTNKVGGMTTYTYDKRGLMLSEVLPITSIRADDTPGAVKNTYAYDSRGNLTQMVEAAGMPEARTTTYTYDKLNQLVTKAGDAVTVTSEVDFSTSSATPTETITYDARGNVIQTVQADGAKRLFFYDALDRKIAEVDALGGLREWTYDKADNAETMRAWDTPVTVPGTPGGGVPTGAGAYRETTYEYDKANRLTKTTVASVFTGRYIGSTHASSVADIDTEYAYDANGNLVETTDALGNKTFSFYDKLGREVARVDAEKYVTTYTRDAEGNVTQEVRYAIPKTGTITTGTAITSLPPRTANASLGDRITTFTYDENGRRLTESRAGVLSYTVDASDGEMDQYTTASTIVYEYDGLGNVTLRQEANGDAVDYEYDLIGRQISATRSAFTDYTGNPTQVQHQTLTSYNGLNGVTRQTEGKVGATTGDLRITTYAYGAGGRMTSTTDATGFTQSFGYDVAGRVVQESWARERADGSTVLEGRRYTYDDLGRITHHGSIEKPDTSWMFGDDQRSVAYNTHGEVVGQGLNGGTQETFAYDAAGRMWRSTGGDGVLRFYIYDATGNATLEVASAGADLSSHTSIGSVWGDVSPSGETGLYPTTGITLTYTVYDKRGQVTQVREPHRQLSRNLTSGAYTTTTIVRSTSYNAFGEVTSQTDARGGVTDFTYNTLGRIIEQKSPEVAYTNEAGGVINARPTETRRYDISGRLVATQDANGNWSVRTLLAHSGHGGAEAVTLTQFNADGGDVLYGYDVFGDQRKVTDALGFVTTKAYDKAGRLTQVVHPGRAAGTPGNTTGSTVQLTDNYEYDELGQRIRHWNSQFGDTVLELTEYDLEGRIVSTTDYEERTTTYEYEWDEYLTTTGLGTFGGWVKDTIHASGKTSTEITDYFGRSIGRIDQGEREYEMTFDTAGRVLTQTSDAGQSLAYEWYNTGLMAEIHDVSANVSSASSGKTLINYEYDASGNRTRERSESTRYTYLWTPTDNYHLNDYDDLYGPSDPGLPTLVTTTLLHQDAYATWDAMDRMLSFTDSGAGGTNPVAVAYTYDLNGNVRSVIADYEPFGTSSTATQEYWYKYDVMNRFTTVMGDLVGTPGSGTIVRGGDVGRDVTWDKNGNRKTVTHTIEDFADTSGGWWSFDSGSGYMYQYWEGEFSGDPTLNPPNPGWSWQANPVWYDKTVVEHYDYTADGYLAEVKVSQTVWDSWSSTASMSDPQLQGRHIRDALGRTTAQTEWWFDGTQSYSRTATYDKTGLVLSDSTATLEYQGIGNGTHTRTVNTTYDYQAETTANTFNGQWLGVITRATHESPLSGGGSPITSTSVYTYNWRDGAQQARIVHTPNTASPSTKHTSTFAYDVNGRLSFVNIRDGLPRNITYVTDMAGQVMSRIEDDGNSSTDDPQDYAYFFGGTRIGQVGNNYAGFEQYATLVNNRYMASSSGPFNAGTAHTYAEFDQAYSSITPNSPGATGGTITARDGDTLAAIAQAVWGDAALWYLLAEANGLSSGSATLQAGQVLTIPAKVGNVHNTSSTFKPYDPNRAIGDVNPTEPAPPAPQQGGKCGSMGKVLVVIIAVAVTALIAPYATAAIANATGMAGVTGGAVGSALAGTGAVGTGLTSAGLAVSVGATTATVGAGALIGGAAIAGAAGSLASQVFGVAAGIQERIDWKGVSISALSAGITMGTNLGRVGDLFGTLGKGMTRAVVQGAANNALTQGIATATGLQHKFDWTGVAVAAVASGTAHAVGGRLETWGARSDAHGFAANLATGMAAATTGAATQSLITGDSFGDTLIATLPQTIGATIGNMIGGQLLARAEASTARRDEIRRELSGLSSAQRQIEQIASGQRKALEGYDIRLIPTTDGSIRVEGLNDAMPKILADQKAGRVSTGEDWGFKTIDSKTIYLETRPNGDQADQTDLGGLIFSLDDLSTSEFSSRWLTVGDSGAIRFISNGDETYLHTGGTQRIGGGRAGGLGMTVSYGAEPAPGNPFADMLNYAANWSPAAAPNLSPGLSYEDKLRLQPGYQAAMERTIDFHRSPYDSHGRWSFTDEVLPAGPRMSWLIGYGTQSIENLYRNATGQGIEISAIQSARAGRDYWRNEQEIWQREHRFQAAAAIPVGFAVGGPGRAAGARLVGQSGTGALLGASNGSRLSPQLLAEEVASGHAIKHVANGEFASLGVRTKTQFQTFVESIVSNPATTRRYAADGTTYYIDDTTRTVVISGRRGEATAFRPDYGVGWDNYLRTRVPSRSTPPQLPQP